MDKEKLKQLRSLRKEIKELDAAIEDLKQQKRVTRDKVQASMSDFPYVRTTATVFSVDANADKARRKKITDKEIALLQRRQQAAALETEISEYIKSVTDSRIRRILRMRYIEGLSWDKVAIAMNYDRTYPEKLLSRYLKEHPD